jgi:[ribosomal protein S5]-alanine N-acetyltransferase
MRLLEYIPGTLKTLHLLAAEPEEFAAQYRVGLHEIAQSVAQTSYDFLKSFRYETRPELLGYLVVEGESQQLAGTCSFKGPPDEDGAVEIAYFTFPGFEGRGIATEMARFLIERAREDVKAVKVIAHTPPERNASTRVLEKIGMSLAGEAEEDGERVWRWELPLR